MKREKICLFVTDDTKIKVINYQVCSGSGRTAYIRPVAKVHTSDSRTAGLNA